MVCLISTLATILQRCTHNETHWPTAARQCHFALQDVSHPAGKVTISQHLATPGFSQFMNELLLKCSCVRLCTKSTRWMKDLQMRTNLSHNKQLSLGLYSVPTNELMAFQYKARKVDSKYFAESSPTFNQHFFLINIFDFMTCYLCILANLLLSENESSM